MKEQLTDSYFLNKVEKMYVCFLLNPKYVSVLSVTC